MASDAAALLSALALLHLWAESLLTMLLFQRDVLRRDHRKQQEGIRKKKNVGGNVCERKEEKKVCEKERMEEEGEERENEVYYTVYCIL